MKLIETIYSKKIRWGIIISDTPHKNTSSNVSEIKPVHTYKKVTRFSLTAKDRKSVDLVNTNVIDKVYANVDDLINDDSIDAIYIATKPCSHKLYSLKVAAAGKICCIEKPLAPKFEDRESILSAFNQLRFSLFISCYRRTLPRTLKVKEILAQDEFGEVRALNSY